MNTKTTDTSGFKYPMMAIVTCKIAGVEYQPKEIFDAKDIGTVNFLKATKSAQMLAKKPITQATTEPAATAVQAKASGNSGPTTVQAGASKPKGNTHDGEGTSKRDSIGK